MQYVPVELDNNNRGFQMNEPTKIKSADGYTFYRLEDGRYADTEQEENIDMSWNSFNI